MGRPCGGSSISPCVPIQSKTSHSSRAKGGALSISHTRGFTPKVCPRRRPRRSPEKRGTPVKKTSSGPPLDPRGGFSGPPPKFNQNIGPPKPRGKKRAKNPFWEGQKKKGPKWGNEKPNLRAQKWGNPTQKEAAPYCGKYPRKRPPQKFLTSLKSI